ncbi:hypothetical protein HUU53_00465 [Candidatus Micrarchaeota archaeon]|nr:hypothetical protein [Candidatus Micrarchaeota archaeon]
MKKELLLILIASAMINAAIISGSVYDSNLNKLENVVLEINTTPQQTLVSKDGNYSFEVSQGTYVITMTKNNVNTESEAIKVNTNGEFNIDLLFLSFAIDTSVSPFDGDVELTPDEENAFSLPENNLLAIGIILVAITLIGYFLYNKKPKTETNSLNDVQETLVSEIKKLGGTTTQTDLRKQVSFSEARVSMELEVLSQKGLVRKYKKGRGNIIELVK